MKASTLFISLPAVVGQPPLAAFSMTLDGHVQMYSPVYLKCLEDKVSYVPGTSNENKAIHITYFSVAIHHLKVRRRDGSIISSPRLFWFLFEGQIHKRKKWKGGAEAVQFADRQTEGHFLTIILNNYCVMYVVGVDLYR